MRYKVNFTHPITGNPTVGVVEPVDYDNNRKKVLSVITTEGTIKVHRVKITKCWKNGDND